MFDEMPDVSDQGLEVISKNASGGGQIKCEGGGMLSAAVPTEEEINRRQ